MPENLRAILELKDTQPTPGEGLPRTSGFATASLVFVITALIFLGVAVPVTLTGSPDAGASVAALLIIAGFGLGVLALLSSAVAWVHIARSRGKRRGYGRAGLSLALTVPAAVVFAVVASKWADRFFRLW